MKRLLNRRYTVTLDDDPMVSKMIEQGTGLRSIAFLSAEDLLASAAHLRPMAAFIDVNLGGAACGLDLVPKLRELWQYAPIIVVTSDPTEEIVGRALDSGADDFIQKPIRPNELAARLQARLGDMAARQEKNLLRLGDISLDPSVRLLKGPNGKRYLSPTEINLLLCLMHGKGTVVSKQRLKQRGWKGLIVSDNALDRKIFELRTALKDVSTLVSLRTAYGKGLSLQVGKERRRAA